MAQPVRIEHDLLGDRAVPADAYYGVHTLRALENFSITGTPIAIYPELVMALACVKQAAAIANSELGLLDERRAHAIRLACEEVREGKLFEEFVVDVIQGGAGTSSNMNANEVICNRALELLGHQKGEYQHLHPLDHVNLSQSTNDVYPTAVKLALQFGINRLLVDMALLRKAFDAKAREFAGVLKVGRTQLQDAVPMTLGQEFSTYAVMLGEDEQRLAEAASLIREINLGATAIGTGINAHPDYARLVTTRLTELSNVTFIVSPNLIEATQDAGSFVQLSGVLKRIAVKLSKICNDLRLLSSGPRAGIGEITLPAVQAGSSIMPGKVNPVIPEVVNQVAFLVIGHDLTVTLCAEGGQLQLNAFEPTIGFCTLQSMRMLAAGLDTLTKRCIEGIEADVERCRGLAINSIGIVTALNPVLGYEVCSRIAKRALQENRSVLDIVLEEGVLTKEQVTELLKPEKMTQPARATID
jgi:aspartate ammonia-lyase